MPAKPVWYRNLDRIIRELQSLPRPFVDRATIEVLLGVGRRRAQQILSPCITDHVGANGLADRETLIGHLQRMARSDEVCYEQTRRRKVAELLEGLRRDRLERPQVLVEAPLRVMDQDMDKLPPGVTVEAGRITIEFEIPRQALEKLLALAMAIGNDYGMFERLAGESGSSEVATKKP
jgi:hypothetical protein